MNFGTLSWTPRPASMAAVIVAKLSSVSTIVAASRAMSVPLRPIAANHTLIRCAER
jgi:hypothetical protein